jgi:hypothetical protein
MITETSKFKNRNSTGIFIQRCSESTYVESASKYFRVFHLYICLEDRDSSVGIAKGYGLNGRGSISGRDKRFFSTPQPTDRFWAPPSLPSTEYWELFPRGVKRPRHEADQSYLVPRSRMLELYLHSRIGLRGTTLQLYLLLTYR